MKTKIFVFAFAVLLASCSKEDSPVVQDITMNDDEQVITETYVYEGKEYTLYFDPTVDDGEPLNNEVAEELLSLLGNQQVWLVGKASELPKRHIYTNADDAEDFLNAGRKYNHLLLPEDAGQSNRNSLRNNVPPCWWFHKDCSFNGETLELQTTANYYVTGGTNNCTHYWSHDNLQNVPRQQVNGDWNDLASSWTLTRPTCMGHSFPDVGTMKIKVYRHHTFPGWSCAQEGFLVDVNNFNISCLNSLHWCVFGSDLNDEISSWRMVICKLECDDCFSISHGER
jgi:hypothetical protein